MNYFFHFKESAIENLVWQDLNEEQIISLIALTPQQLES